MRRLDVQTLWVWLWFSVMKRIRGGWGMCANRNWKSFCYGRDRRYEVTVTIRDTAEEDGYERTEVYRMLREVRLQEKRSNWKCPEPEV